jgi:hypothetical protein
MWPLEVFPGDVIAAVRYMRAWESDTCRGYTGRDVHKDDEGLLISTRMIGNQLRLYILMNERIEIFSSNPHVLGLNWRVVSRPPRGSRN